MFWIIYHLLRGEYENTHTHAHTKGECVSGGSTMVNNSRYDIDEDIMILHNCRFSFPIFDCFTCISTMPLLYLHFHNVIL